MIEILLTCFGDGGSRQDLFLKGVGHMKLKWLHMMLLAFSAVLLSGCGDQGGKNEESKTAPGKDETVNEGMVTAVRSRVIGEPEAEAKKLFANDRNIYVMENKGIEQRRLDGSFVKEWDIGKINKLIYVDNEYVYYAVFYYPDDDGDENACSDVFSIPIRKGTDGDDVLVPEQKEKVARGLDGVVCRPCYINSDHLICVLSDYDFGADLLRYDRNRKKQKGMLDDEYWGMVSFAVLGDTMFSYLDGVLSCQKLDSDKKTKLGSDWLCAWSTKYFFYKDIRQYMIYDEEKQEAELLNSEDLLQKIAQQEQISRSCVYQDTKYGERLFYSENKLYAQIIYHVEREKDAAMERRKCALFSLDLGQECKEWHYEKEMSNVFGDESGQDTSSQGTFSQGTYSQGKNSLGKGFYVGFVHGKAFFAIWTDKNEDAVFGYYDLKTGVVRTFSENDAAYYEMMSDLDIKESVEQEMEHEEE